MDDFEQEIQMRDQCESKVNQYVQELIDKNTDLQKQLELAKNNK